MFSSIDGVIQVITLKFQQLHELAEKYVFLTPMNLLDYEYELTIKYH